MMTAWMLLCAMALDAIFGEPKWLWSRVPHPVVVMGRAISWCEKRWNAGAHRRLKGALVMAGLVVIAGGIGCVLQSFGALITIPIAAILLAQRSLVDHIRAVARGLRRSLPDGQRSVAMIVSRDTTSMQRDDVARAAIESGAENFSDGMVAPAFWFLVAGLPGLLIYKITNTADSTVGYRTARFEAYGWAAARLDDLLNLIPARASSLLIAAPHHALRHMRAIARDAKRHKSPNAGWPEAAMARALDVALAGPRSYHGTRQDFPFVHPQGLRSPGAHDIDACAWALWRAWAMMAGVVALVALM